MSATLWQIPVSHFSEKARWALERKGIEHERRSPPPPSHIPIALWLTRGGCHTFPVLVLDGRAIGDSAAIIAALEEYRPDPPLYPDDPADRRRALEIEAFFDAELGPYARALIFHDLRDSPGGYADLAAAALFGPIVQPPEGPHVGSAPPPAFEEFRATIADRPGYRWVAETFARERGDARRP